MTQKELYKQLSAAKRSGDKTEVRKLTSLLNADNAKQKTIKDNVKAGRLFW